MSATARPPDAVIFDLDGVIRHWNDDQLDEVEAAFGLPPRTIITVAFSPELGPEAITGRLTYREWMDAIRRRVLDDHGDGVAGALDEWEANVGLVDTEMVGVLRSVRRHATVALLSNGTTRLRRDLHVLDLLEGLTRQGDACALIVTHEPGMAARADRVLTMEGGRLVERPGGARRVTS